MKKGIIIYCEQDHKKNNGYLKWLKDEFSRMGILLKDIIKENILLSPKSAIRFSDYDFVINRTRDYNLSLNLELNNIRVFNNSQITLIGNNKLAAYKFAKSKNYLYPNIILDNIDDKHMVVKPVDGHGGNEVYLRKVDDTLDTNIVYQEFINTLVGDIRFYVIGNQIKRAVIRKPNDGFISNYSRGNFFEEYKFSNIQKDYVLEFISGLEVDYAGFDFLLNKNNELIFNEIEDVVGSRMLSELGINYTVQQWVDWINYKVYGKL